MDQLNLSRNLSDVSQNDVDMDQNESLISNSSTPSEVNNTAIIRSLRKNK